MVDQANAIIAQVASEVAAVPGVLSVVLGGSRARGSHSPGSDIDIGIYYDSEDSLDLTALGRVAAALDDAHRPDLVTPIGGWGPRINGGGWLTVQSTAVDLLYRDIRQVKQVIDDCRSGLIRVDYQPGHPFGFVSSIYLGEVAVCRVLHDEAGVVAQCKALSEPFPPALKAALIHMFDWEVDFSLAIARKSVAKADVTYAAGCCFRAAGCMLQVVFALNEQHWLNEKGALALADGFPLRPEQLKTRMERAFALLHPGGNAILQAVDVLSALNQELQALMQI